MLRAGQGPVVELLKNLGSNFYYGLTQNVEHYVVQQIFFRLEGILART